MTTQTNPFSSLRDLSPDFLQRYDVSGPRYTSYPTAPVWSDQFNAAAWRQALIDTNPQGVSAANLPPLSLYTHLPFCRERCLFCSCNVVITQQIEQAERYLGYLFQDSDRLAGHLTTNRPVVQYHWGGGTPTYLSSEQMARLFQHHQQQFTFAADAEISIEVDPRVTTEDQLLTLHQLGFNRISLGVQDFDVTVQQAVHRLQSEEQTASILFTARQLGFTGVNLDLIYGLPKQTYEGFSDTLETVLALAPDRIALYNFAYVPWMSPHQNQLDKETLPSGPEKFTIFCLAVERLTDAGYVYIGMDHFALLNDELAKAQQDGTLHRNFMGYTTKAGTDLLGFGVSAISGLTGYYSQNQRKLIDYYQAIEAGQLPTFRGLALSKNDCHRRNIIQALLCHGCLSRTLVGEDLWQVHHAAFEQFASDGLLELTDNTLTLTPLGRIFSRNVAMQFDGYLDPSRSTTGFSRTL